VSPSGGNLPDYGLPRAASALTTVEFDIRNKMNDLSMSIAVHAECSVRWGSKRSPEKRFSEVTSHRKLPRKVHEVTQERDRIHATISVMGVSIAMHMSHQR
jgi:hypothetical protein